MVINAHALTFSQIADAWAEEEKQEGRLIAPEKISAFLLECAEDGEFEFLELSDDEDIGSKAVLSLHDTKGNKLEKATIANQLRCSFSDLKVKNLDDKIDRYYKLLNKEELVFIHTNLANQIFISKEYFLRWCRVHLEDYFILDIFPDDGFYVESPYFWGDPWDRESHTSLHKMISNRRYILSETLKLFLDYEICEQYSLLSQRKRLLRNNSTSQKSATLARKKLSKKLSLLFRRAKRDIISKIGDGTFILDAYKSPIDPLSKPVVFKRSFINDITFSYVDNSIEMDGVIYKSAAISLSKESLVPANKVKKNGRGSKQVKALQFIRTFLGENSNDWLLRLPKQRFNYFLYKTLQEEYLKKEQRRLEEGEFPAEKYFNKFIRPKLIKEFPSLRLSK